ncbi:pathogen-related protein-like isoform X2 [Salvia miltiorrhiza]|uniref:pathogen-related protein-like isoform X2 n=1 Tax=Salvia miltiorrhiza TaxID=226208 RepID=UPI0025AC0176|nr:pathogen-related protein-like isoform X2 [Salvia miltiorrhiza]
MASSNTDAENYRSFMNEDDVKNINWRYGSAPNYDVVDKLFQEGRTKIWPRGSLEEKVQTLVKTWEMELFHKVDNQDFKTVDVDNYTFSLNEKRKLGGGYISLLQTSLPEKFRCFDPAKETLDSAHRAFTTTFPRGFALEILEVFSGPPVIVYKFRHWGFMEGPFKGHPATGELVEFFGMAIFEVNENSKVVRVEFFYDRGELLGALVKGSNSDEVAAHVSSSCPVLRNTG